jgi:DNA-3-methyladenine glycosylase II
MMRRLDQVTDLAEGCAALVKLDSRLVPVIEAAGPLQVRRREPGFEGLAHIVVAQQLSVASANAIWGRMAARLGAVTAERLAQASDEDLRSCGLSAGKLKTLRAAALADLDGRVRFDALGDCDPQAAHAALVALPGIGPWTADIFLLFCVGHPDIWPAGDLALAEAVRMAFDLDKRPSIKANAALAEVWSPWRGVAALVFWAYYTACKQGRAGVIKPG